MKRNVLLMVFGLLVPAVLVVGQNLGTNRVTSAQASELTSHLISGMDELEAIRFLGTNGISVGMTVGNSAQGTRLYKLSDDSELQLEIGLRPRTSTNRVVESASILKNGKLTSITLTKRP